jgi:membrane associated rhomboid family serine protease
MIPISDSLRSRSFPCVNVVIIALNFAMFLYEVSLSSHGTFGVIGNTRITSELDRFMFHWANIPACTFDALGWDRELRGTGASVCSAQPHPAWTIFSAMFMHGSWIHILGNMLFLWIFGDNVEDAMGHVLYAAFYLIVGTAGAVTHGLIDPNALTPTLGASGAIAGVMGAYIVLYPRATVSVIIPIFFFIPFPLPAFILIGFWFLAQVLSGFSALGVSTVGAASGVAYFAHIGGFIAGAMLVNVFALNRPRRRPKPARGRRDVG